MTDQLPKCPECGADMKTKMNRQLEREFLSCSKYPRCRGTRAIDQETQEAYEAQGAIELEAQDATGYWGGLATPPPTKKEVAEAKGAHYDDAEKFELFKLIFKHGDSERVIEAIVENRKGNPTYPVRLLDESRLFGFVNNHIQELYQAARTKFAVPKLIKLCQDADQDSIEFAATREILDRADGKAVVRQESLIVTATFDEIEAARKQTEKEQAGKGIWYNEDGAVDGENDKG